MFWEILKKKSIYTWLRKISWEFRFMIWLQGRLMFRSIFYTTNMISVMYFKLQADDILTFLYFSEKKSLADESHEKPSLIVSENNNNDKNRMWSATILLRIIRVKMR